MVNFWLTPTIVGFKNTVKVSVEQRFFLPSLSKINMGKNRWEAREQIIPPWGVRGNMMRKDEIWAGQRKAVYQGQKGKTLYKRVDEREIQATWAVYQAVIQQGGGGREKIWRLLVKVLECSAMQVSPYWEDGCLFSSKGQWSGKNKSQGWHKFHEKATNFFVIPKPILSGVCFTTEWFSSTPTDGIQAARELELYSSLTSNTKQNKVNFPLLLQVGRQLPAALEPHSFGFNPM